MNKRFLSVKELSEYLGVSINTIYFWVCQRKVPFMKAGRHVKFDLQDMEVWIKKHKTKPI